MLTNPYTLNVLQWVMSKLPCSWLVHLLTKFHWKFFAYICLLGSCLFCYDKVAQNVWAALTHGMVFLVLLARILHRWWYFNFFGADWKGTYRSESLSKVEYFVTTLSRWHWYRSAVLCRCLRCCQVCNTTFSDTNKCWRATKVSVKGRDGANYKAVIKLPFLL